MSEDLNLKYILDENGNPKLEPDIIKWAEWISCSENRIIQQDTFDSCFVSTVFLGINHAWVEGDPVLYETMAFKDNVEINTWRAKTREEALENHMNVLRAICAASSLL